MQALKSKEFVSKILQCFSNFYKSRFLSEVLRRFKEIKKLKRRSLLNREEYLLECYALKCRACVLL